MRSRLLVHEAAANAIARRGNGPRSAPAAQPLSADLVERGIRVNAISPGPVETAILGRTGTSEEQLKETKDWIRSQVALKRFAAPEEIAEAVIILCSGASSYIVGAEIVIDGGMSL